MTALLRAEARKFVATRSVVAIAGVAVVYGALAVGLATLAPESQRPELDRDAFLQLLRGVADVATPAAVLIGILATAGEYRHGTIVPTLLAEPRRGAFLRAKLVSQAAIGGGIGAAGSAITLAAGVAHLASRGSGIDVPIADLALTAFGVVSVAAVYGVLGASLGALVRNQTAAISAALVWMLAIEEAVPIVLRAPGLRRWLPDGAGTRLLHLADPAPAMPTLWTAVVVLAAAVAVLTVPAAIRTLRSDIP